MAQTPNSPSATVSSDSTNWAAQVRQAKSWEISPFVNWGTGVAQNLNDKFFWAGLQVAKPLTPVIHAGLFSGQFVYGGNIMPLWQAYTPPPHDQCPYGVPNCTQNQMVPYGGGTYRGVSVTPVIFRWDFLTSWRHFQPWVQAAGGVIYTTRKYPPDQIVPKGTPGETCVWNFSPQGGVGFHLFTKPKRSADLEVNAVHISSASLGDKNPGVNASIQVQVNYTFWK